MVYTTGNKSPSVVPPITLSEVAFNRMFKFNYLGLVIGSDLKDYDDMERKRKVLSVRANT